jgi:hypothetical protein
VSVTPALLTSPFEDGEASPKGTCPAAGSLSFPELPVRYETLIGMLREPVELTITDDGTVALPLGLLAEAGISPGTRIVCYSRGDGRIILRREADAVSELMETGELT